MDTKVNKEFNEVFDEVCDCIESILVLDKANSVVGNEVKYNLQSIDLNLEDIKEEIVDEKSINTIISLCEHLTWTIEQKLDLQKELIIETRRKIQEAESWL